MISLPYVPGVQTKYHDVNGVKNTGASLSEDNLYRYALYRRVAGWMHPEGIDERPLDGSVLWIMLNPSTADSSVNDQTIRKVLGFSAMWKFSEVYVANLFALRSPDPKDLVRSLAPVGPYNELFLKALIGGADRIVYGWGAHKNNLIAHQEQLVLDMVSDANKTAVADCLGTTKKAGKPKHPCYLSYKTERANYAMLDGGV